MNSSDLHRAIMLAATGTGARLFRNNVGLGWVGRLAPGYPRDGTVLLYNARPLHAGLAIGSHDLIGLTASGRFVSIDAKTGTGRPSKEQLLWRDMVLRLGGIAGFARSVEEAVALIEGGNS